MVKLRLARLGKKDQPFFRIVASDSRNHSNYSYLDLIGTYNPQTGDVIIDQEKVLKWMKVGAQPTDVVRSFLQKKGILKKFHESKITNRQKR